MDELEISGCKLQNLKLDQEPIRFQPPSPI